ncbi:putative polysaccharide biosynthesis protein [Pseudoflavonifractor phocaeensis]|uniref:putative polysaccharide biosynthesis protein n=1 Tax=Pseudoflavonifractor phocaeensis TaxID=1870988 RepID=UPI001FAF7482|nr:oligosaccharide flippase family protein [Pseudoflavonifractor phocaeensis]
MKPRRTSMVYGTLVLTGTGIAGQFLGFLYRILLSRLIGAEVMGLYQLIMPVYSVLMSLTAVGLTAAVSNLTASYSARGDWGTAGQVLRRCMGCFLILFAVLAGITALLYDPISVYLLGDARTQTGLLLLLPCVLLTGVENLHKHFFYGGGRVGPPALVELWEQVIRAIAVLGLLVLFLPQNPERSVALIVLGMICCEVFSALTLVTLARRRLAGVGQGSLAPAQADRKIFAIALPVGFTSLLGNLMGSANAVLIPQRLVAAGAEVEEAMAEFGVLCGMTIPMLCLPTAFIGALGLVLMPGLAQGAALGDRGLVRRRISRAMTAASVLLFPALALLVVVGPELGTILFREEGAGRYLLPLAVGVLLSCWQGVLGCALNGLGRQGAAARNSLLSGGVQLVCTYVLLGTPEVGVRGYAVGFVASAALGAGLNWLQVRRTAVMKARLFPWLVAPGLSALLMGLTGNLLFRFLLDSGAGELPAMGGCALFCGVLYLAALQAQGLPLRRLFSLS